MLFENKITGENGRFDILGLLFLFYVRINPFVQKEKKNVSQKIIRILP